MSVAYRPENLTEALRLRGETGAIPFAGGTDLMVRYKNWTGLSPVFPGDALFLSHLEEFQTLERQGESLVIGSGVTFRRIIAFPEIPEVLRQAVLSIAAPAIRNIATMTGNVCNASPAGDALCALYALNASVEVKSLGGTREVSILRFITGPGRTLLKLDELVTAIRIPLKPANIQVFRKVGTRKANALAKLSFAAVGETKGDIIDALALILLTIPVFYPVILKLHYDPIWFGVIIVVVTQMGVISPPVGVKANPVTTPGIALRAAVCEKYSTGPRSLASERAVTRAERRCLRTMAAARERHRAAMRRSRLRTPASRV